MQIRDLTFIYNYFCTGSWGIKRFSHLLLPFHLLLSALVCGTRENEKKRVMAEGWDLGRDQGSCVISNSAKLNIQKKVSRLQPRNISSTTEELVSLFLLLWVKEKNVKVSWKWDVDESKQASELYAWKQIGILILQFEHMAVVAVSQKVKCVCVCVTKWIISEQSKKSKETSFQQA